MTINCKGTLIDLSKPIIAGILNLTPDSFYDGGKYTTHDSVKKRIEEIITEGAEIIDIGAYSSRPGAKHISQKEETNRLLPVLDYISRNYPQQIISVDTFRSEIAEISVTEFGVSIINDISAGTSDKNMFSVMASLNVPYIIMHMQGNPQNMQHNPKYDDVIKEIIKFFADKIFQLRKLGLNDIIIDPGFGFGKTIEHNYKILRELEKFKITDCPILVGLSRKSMIYKLLEKSPDDVLPATLALQMTALEKGASILRVHDIKETKQIINVFNKMNSV
jgi:dihydropteroate synthase